MGGKVPRLSIESPCDGLFFPRRRIFCLEASRSTCSWPPIIKVNLDQLLKLHHIRLCFFTATTLFSQVSIWFCLSGCHVLVCFSFICTMPVSLSDFFGIFFSFLQFCASFTFLVVLYLFLKSGTIFIFLVVLYFLSSHLHPVSSSALSCICLLHVSSSDFSCICLVPVSPFRSSGKQRSYQCTSRLA